MLNLITSSWFFNVFVFLSLEIKRKNLLTCSSRMANKPFNSRSWNLTLCLLNLFFWRPISTCLSVMPTYYFIHTYRQRGREREREGERERISLWCCYLHLMAGSTPFAQWTCQRKTNAVASKRAASSAIESDFSPTESLSAGKGAQTI